MDALKIKVFVSAAMSYGSLGHLNLDNQGLLCFYEECLIMAHHFDDTFTAVQLYLLLGLLNEEMKNIPEALIYYKTFLNVAEKLGDNSIILEASTRLGNMYMRLGSYKEAIKCYKKCLDVVVATGDRQEEGQFYRKLGSLHYKLGQFQQATTCFEKFLEVTTERGTKKEMISASSKLGMSHFRLGQYDEAVKYSKKALELAKEIGDRKEEGDAYGSLGNAYHKLGNYEDAVKCFKNYLGFAREAGNKEVERTIYWNLGCAFNKLYKYQEAITNLEKFLDIAIEMGDKKGEVMAYGNLANPYEKMGNYDKLIEISEKSLKLAQETKNKEGEAVAYLHLGVAYQALGKITFASECLEKSLKLAQEIGNKTLERNAYTNLGNVCRESNEKDKAIKHHKESMRLSREMNDGVGESESHLNLGLVYTGLGQYQEAMECYEESKKISTEARNKQGEGTAYLNMGCVSSALCKYHEANECFTKALELFRDVGNKKREEKVFTILGNFYTNLGMYEKSLENHRKSYDIAFEIGDMKGQEIALGNMGSIYQKQGRFSEALENLEKCLHIAKIIGDKTGEGRTYVGIGSLYQLQANYDKAFEYYEKSLDIAEETHDVKSQAQGYVNIGGAYALVENYDEAITYCQKSLKIARERGHKRIEGQAYNNLGSAYYHISIDKKKDTETCQQAKEQAIRYLEEALRCWEWLYGHLEDNDDFKVYIVDTYAITYKMLTTVLIETQQIEKALLVCDRAKGRALGDLLFSKYGMENETSSRKDAILEITDIETTLAAMNFSILSFSFNKGIVAWVLTKENLLFFTQCNNHLLIAESNFTPKQDNEKLKCEDKDLKEIVSQIIKSAFRRMKLYEAIKTENRPLESHENPDHVANSDGSTTGVQDSFSAPSEELTINESDRDETPSGTEKDTDPFELLYTALIAPVVQSLKEEDIVIIPDGPLFTVPFATPRDPTTGRFLSETKTIRLVPSLSALKTLQDSTRNLQSKELEGAVVIGNPEVGEVMFKGEKKTFDRLQEAEKEANVVGASFNVKPLTGSQATKEVVKQKLSEGLGVIHIAAHGDLENGHILLAPSTRTESAIPEEQDYMLTMQEVQEIGVKAQLVVLNCCYSGRGEIRSEGVVGMSRAFLAAGARAVVASLWDIHDEVAFSFVVSFYTYLKQGERASKCLQLAMKEIREEVSDEPQYWAPFFLIGDDVTILEVS